MPEAEVISTLHAECGSFSHIISAPGCVVCRFRTEHLGGVTNRLALTHRVGIYLGSCSPEKVDRFASGLTLPSGSIAVRVKRFHTSLPSLETEKVGRRVAEIVTKGRKVDLETPEVELRILMSDHIHFFISQREIDRKQFDKRRVVLRPFFSPISLHPKYARALVNLTRVRRGERLLDPFCGTGGILMEASSIGIKAIGSDISKDMVAGCKDNMLHFNLPFQEIEAADVGDIARVFDQFDAVATDPPYGRSTSTMKEPIRELYSRAFSSFDQVIKSNGTLAIVLPIPCPGSSPHLALRESHVQRVHRSLIRTYCIFTRH